MNVNLRLQRSSSDSPPLRTILVAMGIPEAAEARLRAEFPDVRFVVPGSGLPQSRQYSSPPPPPSDDDLRAADAIIAWEAPSEMIAGAPRLQWIHAAAAGVEHFDLAAIAERKLMLTNSSGVSAPNMAEHVLGMMVALARRFPGLVQAQSKRAWRDFETHREVVELQGQTVLIVGMGDIGCAVAVRAAAFGMRVHGVRRRPGEGVPGGFTSVFGVDALLSALGDADHVVLSLPDTPGTRGLINAAAIARMKQGAVIYNVGRGTAIETESLIAALQSGHLGGAGLDVTDPEPLPEDSPLWEMDNVLITAHTSGATPRYWERQIELVVDNIGRIQRGESPRNLVELSAGY
jgi:phosphoglycerate dehydrogenase-like enzyme